MLEIKTLKTINEVDLKRLIVGYTSSEKYVVLRVENDLKTTFEIELTTLETPYIKQYEPVDDDMLGMYQDVLQQGYSFGAYEADELIGLAIVGFNEWNNTFWVWEFHVKAVHHGKGVGRSLMNAVIEKGREINCRVIVCETQNTNVPAIRFYRRMGFMLEGIDLSYYSNADYPNGEIAFFMKRQL